MSGWVEDRGIARDKAGNHGARGHNGDFGVWQRGRGEVSRRRVGANFSGVKKARLALVQDEGAVGQIGSSCLMMALGPVGPQARVMQDTVDFGGGDAGQAGILPGGAERAVICAAAIRTGAVACRQRCGLIKKE